MKQRMLGRSGLQVSAIGLGCMGMSQAYGSPDDHESRLTLLRALELGVTFLDTADAYGGGDNEKLVGSIVRDRRSEVVLATKFGILRDPDGTPRGVDGSPGYARQACDASLQRLGIDRIDLYYAHADDATVPLEETLGAFARLIESGKVRAIGASNYSAERTAQALDVSRKLGLPRYEVLQPEYNLVARKGYEADIEPLARRENLGVVCYYALASGFLTGKYRSERDLGKSAARAGAVGKYLDARGLGIVDVLEDIAAARSATAAQVALAWLIARPSITAPIASATSVEQVRDIAGATRLSLTMEDIVRLDEASRD